MTDTSKYWHEGILWGGQETSTNSPSTTKYWHDGMMYGDVLTAQDSPTGNFLIWFF